MSIEFDPAKARANQRKHGVSFAHAEQALRDPMALTIEDPDSRSERRFITMTRMRWAECSSSSILIAKSGRA